MKNWRGGSDSEFGEEVESILKDFNIPAQTPEIQRLLVTFLALEKEKSSLGMIFMTIGTGFGFEMGGGMPDQVSWYGSFIAYLRMRGHGDTEGASRIRTVQRRTNDAIKKAMEG